jgi:hypothetical protein
MDLRKAFAGMLLALLAAGRMQAAVTDKTASLPPASIPLQPAGVPFQDTVLDSTVTRLTGATASGGHATHIYSQLQAFSDDNAYVLLIENEAYVVRRTSDLSLVGGIDSSSWNAPRWQPALPHTLVPYDDNGDADLTAQ